MLNILKNDFTVNFANFIDFLEHHGLEGQLRQISSSKGIFKSVRNPFKGLGGQT